MRTRSASFHPWFYCEGIAEPTCKVGEIFLRFEMRHLADAGRSEGLTAVFEEASRTGDQRRANIFNRSVIKGWDDPPTIAFLAGDRLHSDANRYTESSA